MNKPTALVIDAGLTSRMKTKQLLEGEGFEVLLAADPAEGTRRARESAPDVILLDVVLPDTDGIELCRSWRSMADLREIPVMLMAGERSDRDDRAAGLEAGAMGYVVKPFNVKEMLAQVQLLYRLGRTHAQLKSAARLAESANHAKGRFLANMSHEIRTPLTSILGYAESLLDPELSEKDRFDAVRTILRNGTHLLDVLNDVLDFSKIEAGKLVIERIECGVFPMLNDVITLMRPKTEEKGLYLKLEYRYPVPRRIVTDSARLKQILLNLVGNAVKFTASGGVTVRVSFREQANTMRFEVIDTGIGMPPTQVARLFQPFTQADDSTSRKFGGTGLGLAITKDLAERLGGSAGVESVEGKGSVFSVEVDAGESNGREMARNAEELTSTQYEKAALREPPRYRGRVLVVDDEEDIRRLLNSILRKVGLEAEFAVNGKVGVEKALERPFDLVLMDAQMPVLDGYSAIAQLRAHNYQFPIVALTGNAMEEEVRRLIEAGSNEHLAKPFDRASLYCMLGRYLESGTEDRQEVLVTASAPPPDGGSVNENVLACARQDPELIDLTIQFVDGLPARRAKIGAAFEARDWPELKALAHKLIGAGLYGFTALADAAANLERAAAGQNAEACVESLKTIDELLAEAERTREALRE